MPLSFSEIKLKGELSVFKKSFVPSLELPSTIHTSKFSNV
jgi:hypothetical protein